MSMNLTYHRVGDYLLPDLVPPESPNIGVWGLRRKNYLLKNWDGIYTGIENRSFFEAVIVNLLQRGLLTGEDIREIKRNSMRTCT